MNPPKMPVHIGDLLRDTGHLRALLMGAYMLLLFHHWSTGELPTDDDQLSAIARLSPTEWRKARPILIKFFDEGWRHGRVEEDLASAKASYEARAKAGKKGGEAKAEAKQSPSIATAGSKQPLTFNQGTKEETSSLRSDGARRRGTRLPDEWMPSADDWPEAIAKLSNRGADEELLKFKDYWKAQPGQRGVKLDWEATWRNWIRNAKGQQNHGRRTVHDAANDLLAKVLAFDEPAPGGIRDREGEDAIRLLPPR